MLMARVTDSNTCNTDVSDDLEPLGKVRKIRVYDSRRIGNEMD